MTDTKALTVEDVAARTWKERERRGIVLHAKTLVAIANLYLEPSEASVLAFLDAKKAEIEDIGFGPGSAAIRAFVEIDTARWVAFCEGKPTQDVEAFRAESQRFLLLPGAQL